MVADRLRAGLKLFRERHGKPTALVAAGGVAANEAIRKVLQRVAFEAGTVLVVPPPELCTDNGAMIAWAGAERLALGLTDTLDVAPHARWPLAEVAGPTARAAGHPTCHPRHHRHRPAEDRTGEGRAHCATSTRPGIRPHRGRGSRRLGQRAGERDRARRPHGAARHPRPRRRRSHREPAREPAPARRAARRAHRHRAAERRGRALRRHPAGGAVAAPARGRARDRAGARRRHAGDRLRQGHRARHARIHDRGDRGERRRTRCRRSCRARASPPTWRAGCRRR